MSGEKKRAKKNYVNYISATKDNCKLPQLHDNERYVLSYIEDRPRGEAWHGYVALSKIVESNQEDKVVTLQPIKLYEKMANFDLQSFTLALSSSDGHRVVVPDPTRRFKKYRGDSDAGKPRQAYIQSFELSDNEYKNFCKLMNDPDELKSDMSLSDYLSDECSLAPQAVISKEKPYLSSQEYRDKNTGENKPNKEIFNLLFYNCRAYALEILRRTMDTLVLPATKRSQAKRTLHLTGPTVNMQELNDSNIIITTSSDNPPSKVHLKSMVLTPRQKSAPENIAEQFYNMADTLKIPSARLLTDESRQINQILDGITTYVSNNNASTITLEKLREVCYLAISKLTEVKGSYAWTICWVFVCLYKLCFGKPSHKVAEQLQKQLDSYSSLQKGGNDGQPDNMLFSSRKDTDLEKNENDNSNNQTPKKGV